MVRVILVLPYFGENSRRYLRAVASLPDVALGLLSQQRPEALPAAERALITHHRVVADCLDERSVVEAGRDLSRAMGGAHRVLNMLEQCQGVAAALREALGVEGLGVEATRNFRDKDRMKAVLRAAALPVARSARIESEADLHRFVAEVGFPIVVKPLEGLGSRATVRVRSGDQLLELLPSMRPSAADPWQAEEFVTGEENTLEAVTIDGECRFWSGTWYRPGPLTVLENPWIQYAVCLPRREDSPEHEAFASLSSRALAALGLRSGLTHMEWFKKRDGSFVISEVAARPPGVHIMPMMGRAHGMDMIRAWAELMVFDRFDPKPRTSAVGVAFFRAQGPGERIVRVRGLDEGQKEVGALVVERQLPKVGTRRASGYEGEGWAMVQDGSTARVEHALRRLVELVRVDAA